MPNWKAMARYARAERCREMEQRGERCREHDVSRQFGSDIEWTDEEEHTEEEDLGLLLIGGSLIGGFD